MGLSIAAGALAGIIIFFMGMTMMSDAVLSLATRRLKKILSIFTGHPLLGVLIGAFITALTQSSSGTTVMIVSLVNANILNLYQAAAIIMGANIGSTITVQLISYDFFAVIPHLLFLGILLYHLRLTPKIREFGRFLTGFALLFFGMRIMVQSLYPLKNLLEFQNLIYSLAERRALAISLGAFITAVIQSSSAGIAVLQSLAFQGLIDLSHAFPILMGQNIGTCATTLISSIAADKNGKRAAVIHLLFNLLGTLFFLPLIDFFISFVIYLTPDNTVRQIANAHTFFNLITVMLLMPFISILVLLSKKIIR